MLRMNVLNLIFFVCCAQLGFGVSAQPHTEQPWERTKRLEKARNNTDSQPITPDMCIDGICVEQDLGLLPSNLAWKMPEPSANNQRMTSEQLKAYESGLRRGRETCAAENGAIWGGRVAQLCEYLILGNEKPPAEVVSFFRDNKLPVCVPGRASFRLVSKTDLGDVWVVVLFSKHGRPVVHEIIKEFVVLNPADKATMRKLMNEKHPYAANSSSKTATPWGGYVWYDDGMFGRGPDYRINARNSIFASSRIGPDTGQCATASRNLSVN